MIHHIAVLEQENEALRRQVAQLRTGEDCFRSALRHSPIAVCHHDRELRYTWIYNPHMGFSADEVLGKTDFDILDHDLAERMRVVKQRVLDSGIGERVEMPTQWPPTAGTEFFDLTVEPLRDAEGRISGLACAGVNVTEDRKRAAELRDSEERMRALFAAAPFPLLVTRFTDGRLLLANERSRSLFGITGDDSDIRTMQFYTDQAHRQRLISLLQRDGHFENIEIKGHGTDGRNLCLLVSAALFPFQGEQAALAAFNDITERKRAEDELRRLATTDSLTGVWNRRKFLEQADRELRRAQRHRHPLSLLMVDIDHFKRINDSFGHDTGDDALISFTRIAADCLRAGDALGRLGGEEFAILLPETGRDSAIEAADRLRAHLAAAPVAVTAAAPGKVTLTASIGVTQCTPADHSIDTALSRADRALYRAKHSGRNRVCAE